MKKILCVALALTMAFSFCGCAEKIFGADFTDGYSTFDFTMDSFVSDMQKVDTGEYENPFNAEPVVAERDDEDFGPIKTYTYTLCKDATIVLTENNDTGKMYQAAVIIKMSTTSMDNIPYVYAIMDTLINNMESDADTRKKIIKKLNLSNYEDTESCMNLASGSIAEFAWIISKGNAMLNITAPQ